MACFYFCIRKRTVPKATHQNAAGDSRGEAQSEKTGTAVRLSRLWGASIHADSSPPLLRRHVADTKLWYLVEYYALSKMPKHLDIIRSFAQEYDNPWLSTTCKKKVHA